MLTSEQVADLLNKQLETFTKRLEWVESERDRLLVEVEKLKNKSCDCAMYVQSVQNAYNSGAEAMREKFLELCTEGIKSLRASGETTPLIDGTVRHAE